MAGNLTGPFSKILSTSYTVAGVASQLAVFINSYLSSPIIGPEAPTANGEPIVSANTVYVNTAANVFYKGGIRINAATYKVVYQSDISEQLLVNVGGGKQYISDNIAARPRRWQIVGYIPGENVSGLFGLNSAIPIPLEPVGLFMPSLIQQVNQLQHYYNERVLILFKTRDNELTQVAIESMTIETRPDVMNAVPINITVKEINFLSDIQSSSNNPVSSAAASPPPGSSLGGPVSATSTQAVTQPYPISDAVRAQINGNFISDAVRAQINGKFAP